MTVAGARLALSWLTVLPVAGPAVVDRRVAGQAIALTPVVGLALGLVSAATMWLASWAGLAPALAGLLAVAVLAVLSRGMHLDGLADTFDGLGCYGPADRAREIMRTGGTGPFGVVALIMCLGLQAFSFAALAATAQWWTAAVLLMLSRTAVVLACRRGTPPAPGANFGVLVAGSQPGWLCAGWACVAASALTCTAAVWWLGLLAAGAGLGISALFVRHCVRRLGGVSGDVLGAAAELTLTIAAVVAAARP